ncbi:hypothetical protein AFB00_21620 [Pseudonocardia sp. HH130630-07]|nr:hypothetical protein AFB00_21620 [Pseudonocardia sp. HH130630-07]
MPPAVLAAGAFDLHDLRAHVAQDLAAQRPGDEAGEVQDPQALEGTGEWVILWHGDLLVAKS